MSLYEGYDRHEISIVDELYPAKLREIENPPKTVYCIGDVSIIDADLAILGARRATRYGNEISSRFAQLAVDEDKVLVFASPYGSQINTLRTAVAYGGRVVVVLGSGADVADPAGSEDLLVSVLENGGCIVSEQPWGDTAKIGLLPLRTRIVTALADGIVVVECGEKTGITNACDFALGQGKDIAAVPGNITSSTSDGPNMLIAQGAACLYNESEYMRFLQNIGG